VDAAAGCEKNAGNIKTWSGARHVGQNACSRFQSSAGIDALQEEHARCSGASGMDQLFFDHTSIANPVVQGSFFFVKSSHDISDADDETAQMFGEVASQGSAV